MLLEHKIKIYDALQNLPTVDEKKKLWGLSLCT